MTRADKNITVIVAHQFETLEQKFGANVLGVWFFLTTATLLFAAAFIALAVYFHHYYDTFSAAAQELHWLLAGFNSVVLITSGVAIVLAKQAAESHRRRPTLGWLTITILLGIFFLCVKGYEYYCEYQAGLMPFLDQPFAFAGPNPHNATLFYNFYYALTGLHVFHMIVGLGTLFISFVLSFRWRKEASVARQISTVGLYWAFIEISWILIFGALYLVGR